MPEDRRETRRFPVPEGRETIELKNGRKSIRGRLVDVSSGGFAVEVDAGEKVATGTLLELRTCGGEHIVQVARAVPGESAMCLGLVRVKDVLAAEPSRRRRRRFSRAANALYLIPVIAGTMICAVTVCVACMGPEWTEKSIINPASESLARAFNFDEGRRLRARYGTDYARPSQADHSAPTEPPRQESDAPKENEDVDGSWTAWSEYMKLTSDQLRELRSQLNDRFDAMKPSQLDELPAEGRQKIDEVLSPDQKQRLTEFLSSKKGR